MSKIQDFVSASETKLPNPVWYMYVKNVCVPIYISWECDILKLTSKSIQQRPQFNHSTFHSWIMKTTKKIKFIRSMNNEFVNCIFEAYRYWIC